MIPVQLFEGVLSFGGPDVGWMNYRNHAGGFIASMVMARLDKANTKLTCSHVGAGKDRHA